MSSPYLRVVAPGIRSPDALAGVASVPLSRKRGVRLSLRAVRSQGTSEVVALVRLHTHLAVRGKSLLLDEVAPAVARGLRSVGLAELLGGVEAWPPFALDSVG